MNLAYAVKRAPSSGSTSSTRWVLFPTHDFPLSDFRAVVNAQVRIGRSGLLWKKHVLALETIRENRGGPDFGQNWSRGCVSPYWDLEFGFWFG